MDPNTQTNQADQSALKATGSYKYLQPYKTKGQIMLDNFLGGFSWSFGSFVGLSIIVVIIGYLISQINLIPIIGNWVAQILQDATSKLQPPIQPIE